jgi:thiamine monophosphate kinase
MKEFDLIKKYFTDQAVSRKDVQIGIGDDCAVICPPERQKNCNHYRHTSGWRAFSIAN